jgi:hypothetical protein
MSVCVCVCVCVYVQIHIYRSNSASKASRGKACVCMCVCVYKYIHIQEHLSQQGQQRKNARARALERCRYSKQVSFASVVGFFSSYNRSLLQNLLYLQQYFGQNHRRSAAGMGFYFLFLKDASLSFFMHPYRSTSAASHRRSAAGVAAGTGRLHSMLAGTYVSVFVCVCACVCVCVCVWGGGVGVAEGRDSYIVCWLVLMCVCCVCVRTVR